MAEPCFYISPQTVRKGLRPISAFVMRRPIAQWMVPLSVFGCVCQTWTTFGTWLGPGRRRMSDPCGCPRAVNGSETDRVGSMNPSSHITEQCWVAGSPPPFGRPLRLVGGILFGGLWLWSFLRVPAIGMAMSHEYLLCSFLFENDFSRPQV